MGGQAAAADSEQRSNPYERGEAPTAAAQRAAASVT